MRKTLLITFGILLVLIIGAVWAYLFIFGAPKSSDDIFSNFGFGSEQAITPPPAVVDAKVNEESPQALRQLTTRPVAGATFLDGGIRYMEKGTGHVYDIKFSDGNESLVSGTTIPRTTDADFATRTDRVLIITEENERQSTIIGNLLRNGDMGSIDGKTLPTGAREAAWGNGGESVQYLMPSREGSMGIVFNTETNESETLFTLPLRDIEVLWGDSTYIYTTPSGKQNGYIYSLDSGNLAYYTEGGFGLVATRIASGTLQSFTTEAGMRSVVTKSGITKELPVVMFPEKCIQNPIVEQKVICAAPKITNVTTLLPDAWYKGTVSFTDTLWNIDTETNSGQFMADFLTVSGREIDVAKIGTDPEGKYIWLINKNDDTLWMFDTTI